MMAEIKIHVFHTGEVCVAPDLPFGGEHCSTIKASGAFAKKSERLWLPVSAYLIECSHGKIIFDCGWHRNMSPDGVFDKKAQIKSLGSLPLYVTNQGRIEKGLAIDEQLAALGIHPADLDLVLLSHLDCDHTNGLNLVADAKQILVSKDELLLRRTKRPSTASATMRICGAARKCRPSTGTVRKALRENPTMYLGMKASLWSISLVIPKGYVR